MIYPTSSTRDKGMQMISDETESVTTKVLSLEHINDTIPEFGNFWIHNINGHDDVAEIKWKAKMNGPTQEGQR